MHNPLRPHKRKNKTRFSFANTRSKLSYRGLSTKHLIKTHIYQKTYPLQVTLKLSYDKQNLTLVFISYEMTTSARSSICTHKKHKLLNGPLSINLTEMKYKIEKGKQNTYTLTTSVEKHYNH